MPGYLQSNDQLTLKRVPGGALGFIGAYHLASQ
jgi:hypothetical protein